VANIREHCSWVHDDPVAATEKAVALTPRRGVARGAPPAARAPHGADGAATLVLGGGIAGITAALQLADAGYQVYLVEKAEHLGGNVARVDLTAPHLESARDLLADALARVFHHEKVEVLLASALAQLDGYAGNFTALVRNGHGDRSLQVGSVVVCTGYREFDAARVRSTATGASPT